MPKFRKKALIEAEQFFSTNLIWPKNVLADIYAIPARHYVITAHYAQKIYIKDGDWIVQEPETLDRAYPITDEIMKLTYEEVHENVE